MRSAKPKAKAGARVTTKARADAPKRTNWGGKRPGAGRKPKNPNRLNMPHRPRPPHEAAYPLHVVLRRARGVPSLRAARFIRALRQQVELIAIAGFRVLRATSAAERVHMIVEADSTDALSRGMAGLTIRVSRSFNKLLERSGKVWDDRYRGTPLRSVKDLHAVLADAFPTADDALTLTTAKTSVARRG